MHTINRPKQNTEEFESQCGSIYKFLEMKNINDFILFLSYNQKTEKTKIISEHTFFNTVFDDTFFNKSFKKISGTDNDEEFKDLDVNCNEDIKKLLPFYFPFQLKENKSEFYFMIGFCNDYLISEKKKYYTYNYKLNKNIYFEKFNIIGKNLYDNYFIDELCIPIYNVSYKIVKPKKLREIEENKRNEVIINLPAGAGGGAGDMQYENLKKIQDDISNEIENNDLIGNDDNSLLGNTIKYYGLGLDKLNSFETDDFKIFLNNNPTGLTNTKLEKNYKIENAVEPNKLFNCGFSYKLLNDIINKFKSEETNLIRNFEINVDVIA